MAIVKAVNRTSKSNAGMRNSIEYVMNPKKTTLKINLSDGNIIEKRLIDFNGPQTVGNDLDYFSAYRSFMEEKQTWDKLGGTQYYHNVISFAPNDELNPYDVMEIAQEFVDKYLRDFQTVIAVHMDKQSLHAHLISNSVSYIDGHKCQITPKTLRDMKKYINEVCLERGLTIAVKGKHYDGTDKEPYELTTCDTNKYHLLANNTKKSYLIDCAMAIDNAKSQSANKDEFIDYMLQSGWKVTWTDKRKYITFENEDGKKVRNSNIEKTFNMPVSKEDLEHEFERQNKIRQQRAELNGRDTDTFIREIEANEAMSRAAERERQLEEEQWTNVEEVPEPTRREKSHSYGFGR